MITKNYTITDFYVHYAGNGARNPTMDYISLEGSGTFHNRVYFDERQEMIASNPYLGPMVIPMEEFFDSIFGVLFNRPMAAMVSSNFYENFLGGGGSISGSLFFYYPNNEHIPPQIRDRFLLIDPIALEFFIRHTDQKIPEVLIPKVMAGRVKPFVKEQLALLPSANGNHATIYKKLLLQWLTASFDPANETMEKVDIFKKILAHPISQFSSDVAASRVWGGVLLASAYDKPATGVWNLSYPDGNNVGIDGDMLANAGDTTDSDSNYSKARAIIYPPISNEGE